MALSLGIPKMRATPIERASEGGCGLQYFAISVRANAWQRSVRWLDDRVLLRSRVGLSGNHSSRCYHAIWYPKRRLEWLG